MSPVPRCIVAAADTCMKRDSAELLAEVYPSVPLHRLIEGRETLLCIDKARALLGYEPAHQWTDPDSRSAASEPRRDA